MTDESRVDLITRLMRDSGMCDIDESDIFYLLDRLEESDHGLDAMTTCAGELQDKLNEIEAALPMDYWDVHLRLADAEATINTVIHLVDGLGDWITKASIKALLKEHKL